jgi:hypothetical protein
MGTPSDCSSAMKPSLFAYAGPVLMTSAAKNASAASHDISLFFMSPRSHYHHALGYLFGPCLLSRGGPDSLCDVTNVNEPSGGGRPSSLWLIITGIVGALALVFLAGAGFGQQWGAQQWGPVAAWLSSALTLAAVVVALRQAAVAQRQAVIAQAQADTARRGSLQVQFDRLVDHEMSRRRECIDALSDLWAAIVGVGNDFLVFTQALDDIDATFEMQHSTLLNSARRAG